MSKLTLKVDHLCPQKFYPHKSSLSKSVKCTLTILYPQKVKKCPKKCILAPSENELAALKIFNSHPKNSHFILSKLITSHPSPGFRHRQTRQLPRALKNWGAKIEKIGAPK